MKLTDKELAAMPEKSLRDADAVALYIEHDFLDAYALHTARRIETTGYRAAIGGGDNWDAHGKLQLDFLRSRGMTPAHVLLDLGCGTGRLARKAVPYLDRGNYAGVDISADAVSALIDLAEAEGWNTRGVTAHIGTVPADWSFDFVWSFSVFIHLPQDVMESVMRSVAAVMHAGSQFFWAYVPEARSYRSGLKQFRHTLDDYARAAAQAGLTFDDVPGWIEAAGYVPQRWTGSQRVARSMLVVR